MKQNLIGLIVFLIAIGLSSGLFLYTHPIKGLAQKYTPTLTPAPIHLDPYKIYNLINDYRASKGLNKLMFDPSMCDYANKRLQQIHTDWSHKGFLASWPPYQLPGYSAGENLAKNQTSESSVYYEWLASPEHLVNIVKPVYDRTCITTDTVNGTTFTVQEFASN